MEKRRSMHAALDLLHKVEAKTLKEAFAMKDQLVFLDFITDQAENVYPMIAAGKGHNEMHLHPGSGEPPQERELA